MAYIDHVLEPGETVRWRASVSWTTYAWAIALAACGVAALVVGAVEPGAAYFGGFVAVIFAAAAVVAFIPAWFRRWTTEIAITDRRIIVKRGLFRRRTIEMNMQKVESVDVDQSLLGRLFDYGDVTFRGTGATLEVLHRIDAPLKLRTTVTAS